MRLKTQKNGDVPDMFLSLKFHTRATLGVFGLECPRKCQKKYSGTICSRSQLGDFLEWGYPQIIHKHLFWGTPIYGTTLVSTAELVEWMGIPNGDSKQTPILHNTAIKRCIYNMRILCRYIYM